MAATHAHVQHDSADLAIKSVPGRALWQRRYGRWLQVSDAVVACLAVAIAQWLRFGFLSDRNLSGFTSVDYTMVSTALVAGWVLFLTVGRAHSPQVIGAGHEEFRRVWTATLSAFGAIAIISTLLKLDVARGYLAIALPLGLAGLTVNRIVARRYVAARRRHGHFMTAVLALGRPDSIKALGQSLARHPQDGYTLVGACTFGAMPGGTLSVEGGDIPVFPYDGDIRHAVAASRADTVALTSTGHLGPQAIRDLSWQLEKIDVDLVVSPGMVDVAGPRLTVRPVADLPLIHVDKPQYNGAKRFQKRLFDICFSMMVLIAASPLMVAAALAVKLTSRGPVFYLSERVGLDGEVFRMIKFRTMVEHADTKLADIAHLNESDGVLFKIRSDPRVTPVGRVLRRYSIDELPQFINVLRREMSVVGPRPPLPREVESYDYQVRRRLLVRPGITGLWQVSGRSDLSWEDSVRLDLSYVENWSMVGDLIIAANTVKAVFGASGAY